MKKRTFLFSVALVVVLGVQAACQSAVPAGESPTQQVTLVSPTNTLVVSTTTPSPVPLPTETATPVTTATPEPTATPTIPVTPPASGKAAAIGRVLWNDQPVAEYKVQLCEGINSYSGCWGHQYSVYTNKQGYYIFNNVTPGEYVVIIHISNGIWLYKEKKGVPVKEHFTADQITSIEESYVYKFDLNISYPAAGQKISEGNPTLKWKAYPGAAYYTVSLFGDHNTILNEIRVDSNEYRLENPLLNCRYMWGLNAFNAKGVRIADLSALKEFTVVNQPLSCNLKILTPAKNGETANPVEFSWEAHPLAVSYTLEVENDETSKTVLEEKIGNETSYISTITLPAGRYRWTLDALDASGKTVASSGWANYFTVIGH